MRVSWKWLSEMLDLSGVGGPDGLATLLTGRGLEVEAIERQDQGFDKVVTVRILERNKHPEADRLSLCKVTLGSGDPLEIVCGAQNMKAGDTVALAQIGAHLPNGIKIEKSKIRGVVSNGMLCSEQELKLKDTSEGILILPPDTPLGKPLAEILGRDDTIFTLKLTANRGDCLSHYGLARELGAALGQKPRRPEAKPLSFHGTSPISVHLDAGEAGPQFFGCYLEGIKVGPSPDWLVKKLEAVGGRSINNVVDATNLVMWELGQPVHAYDADRIAEGARGKEIRVRNAVKGESLPLLDGSMVELDGSELVIADGKRAVGLAGVMGGGNSEVQPGTTRVFLECAEFDPVRVRRTSKRHLKHTDAAHRFERGVDPAGQPHAIARLASLVQELAGGVVKAAACAQLDSRKTLKKREVKVDFPYFQKFLGMSVSATEAEKILTSLDCTVSRGGDQSPASGSWTVGVPSYRLDLNLKEDLAEEIARSIGYEKISETMPALSSAPRSLWDTAAGSASTFLLIDRAKEALVQAGLSETLNYSFTSKSWLSKLGMSSSVVLLNPLSEEHEAMVPSLLPGLISNALTNWRHHFGSESLAIRLFEIRPAFQAVGEVKAQGEYDTGVQERWKLSFVMSGPRFVGGLRNELGEIDLYDMKAVIESLLSSLGAKGVRFHPMAESRKGPHPLFHPGQSVEVLAGNEVAGCFGLIHPGTAKELKLRAPLWMAEIDWHALAKLSRPVVKAPSFRPIPAFPSIERDFALVVKADVSADKITQIAVKAGKPLAKVVKIFDVYRGSQVAQGMTSVAVRVIFYDESRSLQESEAEAASAQILNAWKKELGAELRS